MGVFFFFSLSLSLSPGPWQGGWRVGAGVLIPEATVAATCCAQPPPPPNPPSFPATGRFFFSLLSLSFLLVIVLKALLRVI